MEVEGPDHKPYGPSILNPRKWIFSSINQTDQGVYFSMTHNPTTGRILYKSLVLTNWIGYKNSSNSSCDGICVKYDVALVGYEWQSSDPNASLAFVYSISSSENSGNNNPEPKGPLTVSVGKGYFNIIGTAISTKNGESKEVNASLFQDKKDTWVIYSHFTGDLYHDPSIGVSNEPFSLALILTIVFAFLLLVILTVFSVYYFVFRKRSDYSAL